jgi:Erythromycin biosynthesis protein CIII-like, C-terminal domain
VLDEPSGLAATSTAPDASPFPDVISADAVGDTSVENAILGRVNDLLRSAGLSPLQRASQLYSDADQSFLLTFAELDHYRGRVGSQYWGMWSPKGGIDPPRVPESGKRLFAYLQPPIYSWTPATVLNILRDLEIDALVYVPEVDEGWLRQFKSPRIVFETRRMEMAKVCEEYQCAITHGNNGTATQLLRGAIPQLIVPIYLEQVVFSRRLAELGAALVAPPDRPEQIARQLQTLLGNEVAQQAAAQFAHKYRDFDPRRSVTLIADRIECLAMAPTSRSA